MSREGSVVMPDSAGRCGACGFANFQYDNGNEFAADGTRGYRCVNCGGIKPENWRRLIPSANDGWAHAHEPAPDPTGRADWTSSPMRKLTPAQRALLLAASDGPHYPDTRGERTVARNLEALRLGVYDETIGAFTIFDAGRAAIARDK